MATSQSSVHILVTELMSRNCKGSSGNHGAEGGRLTTQALPRVAQTRTRSRRRTQQSQQRFWGGQATLPPHAVGAPTLPSPREPWPVPQGGGSQTGLPVSEVLGRLA